MSIFIGSTESLTVTLDAAPTNQLPCTASYVDQGGLGGDSAVNTTGVTAVTLVGPPGASVERLVSNIMIHNSDVATRTISVSKGSFLVGKFTVLAGNHLCYDGGWKVLDASGNFLCNVTVTGGTLTANQGAAAAITAPWPVELSNGTTAVGTSSAPLRIDPTGTTTQPVSFTGTPSFNLAQVDGTALGAPVAYGSTPTGNAISVNAFVTNGGAGGSSNITQWNSVALGSPSNYGTSPGAVEVIGTNAFVTNTVTVDDTTANLAQASTTSGQTGVMAQGAATTAAPTYTTAKTYPLSLNLAGGLRVDGSGVTQPVSLSTLPPLVAGSAAIGTVGVTSLPSIPAGSNVVGGVTQSGAWTVTTTPPSNASTNLSQLDGVALGAPSNYGTSPGAVAVQGVNAFITNLPATQPVSIASTVNVDVTNFPATQTVSGTVAVTQSGSWTVATSPPANASTNLAQLAGTTLGAPSNYGTAPGAVEVLGVNAFVTNTVPVTGAFFQATQPVSGTVTANQGTSPWVVSLASTTVTGTVAVTQSTSPWTIQGDSASGASNAGNPVKVGCVFNTTQPTVTTGQTVDGQATARGAQIVATGVDTFNVTVNAALPAGANAIGSVSVSNFPSSQAVTGTFFQATQPVSGTVAATQSGTWTVQPGNTANTTPWLVTANAGTGNFATNNTQWGGVALGSPSSYGTSPGAVAVPGVNAFVTNPVSVTGTFWQATQPVSGVVQAVNAANVFSASFLATRTVATTSAHTITGIQVSTSGIVGTGTCTVNVQAGTTPFATILSINLAPTATASSSMIIDLTDLSIAATTGFSIIATNTFVTSGYINCAVLYN